MSQETPKSAPAENYTAAEKALEVLAAEMQSRIDAMTSRTVERLRELFAPVSVDRLSEINYSTPPLNPRPMCPVADSIAWVCTEIICLGLSVKKGGDFGDGFVNSTLVNVNNKLRKRRAIRIAINGRPRCIKLGGGGDSMSLDQLYDIAESTFKIIEAGLEGYDPQATSGVIKIIDDIRAFLSKSVQHGIFMPVMFGKDVDQQAYFPNIQKILEANSVDSKKVEYPPLKLGGFVDDMVLANRYTRDLTINDKRIVDVRPMGSRFVYGEGRAVVVVTDSEGRKIILKFIVKDKWGYAVNDLMERGCTKIPNVDDLNKEFDILTAMSPTEGIPRPYEKGAVEIDNGEKLFYIAEEYFEGEDLDELSLAKNTPLKRVIKIISSLLSIIGSLHNKGYVYRDISPRNILISDGDEVRLCDFGLTEEIGKTLGYSKQGAGTGVYISIEDFIDFVLNQYVSTNGNSFSEYIEYMISGEFETESLSRKLIGEIVGTHYCPRGQVAHPARDIYATGVLLYELLGGELKAPFMVGRISCNNPVVGQQLTAIIKKATAVDYRQRYQSAAEMLADIEKIQLVQDSR